MVSWHGFTQILNLSVNYVPPCTLFPATARDRSGVIQKWERKTSWFMLGLAALVCVTSLASNIYWFATSQKGAPGNDQAGT